jgi:hypothetical protein
MKFNWPLAVAAALFIIPASTLVPNGQQEAFAQVGFAQTIEECRLAGPGYTQEFMCADGEKLRLYIQQALSHRPLHRSRARRARRVESGDQPRRSTHDAEGRQGR